MVNILPSTLSTATDMYFKLFRAIKQLRRSAECLERHPDNRPIAELGNRVYCVDCLQRPQKTKETKERQILEVLLIHPD